MTTVTVHALSTGNLTLPERFFVKPADPEASKTVPSLSFLVQHGQNSSISRIVFDLGLRRDLDLYPTVLAKHCASRAPISTQPDAVASLAKGGLTVDEIDYIIFSHVHYDHIGMPSDFSNPRTKFVIGPGSSELLSGKIKLPGTHSVFEPDLLPTKQTIELPRLPDDPDSIRFSPDVATNTGLNLTWTSIGPFPHAIDLFSDGSVYILSAPGHLIGHINLLCRITQEKYVILAGDACHDMRLFTGECEIATWTDNEGAQHCIHSDIPMAQQTIQRLAQVQQEGLEVDGVKANVEVVFAHNWQWEEEAKNSNRFWPGSL